MRERQTPRVLNLPPQRCVIEQDTLLSENTCTANKYQLHRHNFGHGRITIHPDLFNRNASA